MGKVLLGIDGIIDEVWQMVDARTDAHNFTPMEKMADFGQIILDRGGGGLAKELVRKRRVCGGFTPNTGRAVARLGIEILMVGMYGESTTDPAFDEFSGHNIISLGAPAVSNIIEFTDGKIMMPHLENLLHFDWTRFKAVLDKNPTIFNDVDIAALGYWSNMPDFDNMLMGLVESYFQKGRLFFDFANIAKRSAEALKKTLGVMGQLNSKVPMTLSLNEHEGNLVFEHYDIKGDILACLNELRKVVGINEIIVHTPHIAAMATATEGNVLVEQNFIAKPVRTTGAGDTFNGGYIAACMDNIGPKERLLMANKVAHFYLLNGRPPGRGEL